MKLWVMASHSSEEHNATVLPARSVRIRTSTNDDADASPVANKATTPSASSMRKQRASLTPVPIIWPLTASDWRRLVRSIPQSGDPIVTGLISALLRRLLAAQARWAAHKASTCGYRAILGTTFSAADSAAERDPARKFSGWSQPGWWNIVPFSQICWTCSRSTTVQAVAWCSSHRDAQDMPERFDRLLRRVQSSVKVRNDITSNVCPKCDSWVSAIDGCAFQTIWALPTFSTYESNKKSLCFKCMWKYMASQTFHCEQS